jgi:hypothetical protein
MATKPAWTTAIMDAMDTPSTKWITIAAYENPPGRPTPMTAIRA